MSEHEWKYLGAARPARATRQLCIKGKRIWAWTLYCEFMSAKEPRTPEQLATDWDVPLAAVQEAIAYCQSDPPELREDHRKDDLLAEATGMNDPAINIQRQATGPDHRRAREARPMRLYVDDDSVDPILLRLLRRDGHDVQIPGDVGRTGSSDQAHLAHAIRDQRAVLTRRLTTGTSKLSHDLVVLAATGHHAGILVVRCDNDLATQQYVARRHRPRLRPRNLRRISGVAVADSYHELNHWQ